MSYVSRAFAVAALVAVAGCQQSSTSSGVSGSGSSEPSGSTPPTATSSTPAGGGSMMTASGVKIEELVVGTGATAESGKMVSVNYTGWLLEKSKAEPFDSSVGKQPYEFPLGQGQVVKGWDEGIVGMKVGGKRMLTIPPDLGYGAQGNGPVPPNATMVFEVELMGVR